MKTPSRKQLWSACLGNLFEHYDTALLGFLSPFLAPLIFPQQEAITALALTYAIIPLGMLARPLGALVFGYIGDVYGRERSLFLTLAGMALISGCIAFTPTYVQAGAFAPILFFFGRACQNFVAAGETMGGAIFLLENTSEKRRDLMSSFYSASAMGGHLLASLGVYTISKYSIIEPGWRLLYLFGCLTALFGCFIRKHAYSAPRSEVGFSQSIVNLKRTLWANRKSLLIIILSVGFGYSTYSIALVLMNGFIPLVSSITKAEVMRINSYLLILDVCALPLFGLIATKISREKLMLFVCLSVISLSIPLLISLKEASIAGIIGVRMVFVIFGVAFFAPFHAWAQQLVPSHCRYAVISLGYAIGSQVLGSPSVALALWCFKKTGMISSVAWYWICLAIGCAVSIVGTMFPRNISEKRSTETI